MFKLIQNIISTSVSSNIYETLMCMYQMITNCLFFNVGHSPQQSIKYIANACAICKLISYSGL